MRKGVNGPRCAVAIWILIFGSQLLGGPSTQPTTEPALTRGKFSKTITKTVSLEYLVHLPKGYGKEEKSPLLIALHGSGECGHDLKEVAFLPKMIVNGQKDCPFVVVAPQLASDHDWWSPEALDGLLDELLAKYEVDPDRVYLTGMSLGAYGVWDWACHSPERFAAIAPISGQPNPDWFQQLEHVPVWAFHGALDKEVWPHEDEKMIKLLKEMGADAKLTMYVGVAHNAWSRAYREPGLWEWMVKQKRWRGGSVKR
jgi:predicted peptidase